MTPNEEMEYIVNNTPGMCWPERTRQQEYKCCTCGVINIINPDISAQHANPSPTDMNALMECAEKLGFDYKIDRCQGLKHQFAAAIFVPDLHTRFSELGDDRVTPFRAALVQAIKGGK